ncbi:serine/threonine protein kinase, putative, partial [Entamoeba invadens IP1]|uniref:serine/threonine protein kinase, putative n=1 Tax=Entamoeba invadens IP1 TaxID=370355 RepID=UPI0002C3E103
MLSSSDQTTSSRSSEDDDAPPLGRSLYVNTSHNIPESLFTNAKEFKKVALIGRGNMGRVYLVQSKKTKELYSMKVMDKKLLNENRKRQERLEEEKEILQKLKHPFIVKLECTFESPSHHLLIMTYCAGGDFWRLLRR